MSPPPLAARETVRKDRFGHVWSKELDQVFAEVAPYYDRANEIAGLGLFGHFRRRFMSTIAL